MTTDSDHDPRERWRRIGWFAALYGASIAVLGVVAYAIRAVIL